MTCFILLIFCNFAQAYSPTGTALEARILIEAVRNLHGECMEGKGIYLIDGYGACRGMSFSPVLERSGLGDVLEKHTWQWLPYPGKISVEEKSVMISFIWTQEAEDFFNTTVLGIDGLRIPLGFEIDLIARDGNDVFSDVYLEDDNIPDDCNMIQDDTSFDNKPSLVSRLIQYPHLLKSGERYWMKFSVTDPESYLVSNLVTLGLSF